MSINRVPPQLSPFAITRSPSRTASTHFPFPLFSSLPSAFVYLRLDSMFSDGYA